MGTISNKDLAPLLTMAIEEPDINARVHAVMSLGTNGFESTEYKDALFFVIKK